MVDWRRAASAGYGPASIDGKNVHHDDRTSGCAGMTSPQLFTPQSLPILSPDDWPCPVAAVFNPGTTIHDGRIILLCRGGGPQRRLAPDSGPQHRRPGGLADRPSSVALAVAWREPSCLGVEDPRISWVEELGGYVIVYVRHGVSGSGVALAITRDFRDVEHIGHALPPEDGNPALLSSTGYGRYLDPSAASRLIDGA